MLLKIFLLIILVFTVNIKAEPVKLTIYNQKVGYVKNSVDVSGYKNEFKLVYSPVPETIIAESLFLNSDKIKLLDYKYKFDLNVHNILDKYINEKIKIIRYDKDNRLIDTRTGKLLSIKNNQPELVQFDNEIEIFPDGKIVLPEIDKYELFLKPTIIFNFLKLEKINNLEFSYMFNNIEWNSVYNIIIDNENNVLSFDGKFNIENNSGVNFKNVNVDLIAGELNFLDDNSNINRRPVNRKMYSMAAPSAESYDSVNNITPESVDEFYKYKISNKVDLLNDNVNRIDFLNKTGIKFEKIYVFDDKKNFYRPYWNYNVSQNKFESPLTVYEIDNKKSNNLGIPLPEGKINIFIKSDNEVSFVGQHKIKHIPVKNKIKIVAGKTYDIKVKKTRIDYQRTANSMKETYKIEIINSKTEDVVVNVIHSNINNNWEITDTKSEFVKLNSSAVEFKVPVKSESNKEIEYTISSWWSR